MSSVNTPKLTTISTVEKTWFTAVLALLQAFVLHFAYVSLEEYGVLAVHPEYLNASLGFAIAFPLVLLFIRKGSQAKKTLIISFVVALLIALCGYYAGLQSKPIDRLTSASITSVFVLCALVIAFKSVIYAQVYVSNSAYSFANLYQNSWRTFIVGFEAWIFTWVVFGILFLGAALFGIIGIELFSDLLDESYVTIPIFTLSFSFAINYFQTSEKVADTIAMVLQTIIKFVLPLICIILIGFALSMIFTGVGTLWEDGPGSILILWLQALALFFVNTVYMGTQKETPYKPWLHKLVLIGIAFLPIYSVLASYGLWLRIDQYGLTPSRGFGMLVNLLICSFSCGYFFAIAKARSDWFLIKNKINVGLGIAVVCVCALLNSPILSMQVWSTHSQMERLDLSKPIEDEDFVFFKRNLGASGYRALLDIEEQMLALDISHKKRFDDVFRNYKYNRVVQNNDLGETVKEPNIPYKTWPENIEIPKQILDATFKISNADDTIVFVQVDLNSDSVADYVSIISGVYTTRQYLWVLTEKNWVKRSARRSTKQQSIDFDQFLVAPNTKEVSIESAQFKQLRIGGSVIYIEPDTQVVE